MLCKTSILAITLPLSAFAACGTDADDANPPNEDPWYCAGNRDRTSCACERIPEDVMVFSSDEVPLCQEYTCCLHSPDEETDFGTGSCRCLDTDNCAAEASSRPGATVVALCPPDATIPPVQCASQGENCRYDYLQGRGFEGCCTGSVCRQSPDGIPLCQPATEDESAAAAKCSTFARSTATHDLELVTPTLTTSVGTITLPPVMYGFLEVGPLGCVSSMHVVLDGGLNCGFQVAASATGSQFTLTSISGDLSGCPGYTGEPGILNGTFVLTEPQGTMTFTGAACDSNLIFEAYDVAGRFDFHLAGGTSYNITLADQHLIVEGAASGGEPNGECAAM